MNRDLYMFMGQKTQYSQDVIFPKLISQFNEFLLKIQAGCFSSEIDKVILKVIWKYKGPRAPKNNSNKKKLCDFKNYFKATLMKTV